MPPTRTTYLRRRMRQADAGLKRGQKYLASVIATIGPQHPELTPTLFALIGQMEGLRVSLLQYHRAVFSGTERSLWKPGDLGIILEEAEPVPDPQQG